VSARRRHRQRPDLLSLVGRGLPHRIGPIRPIGPISFLVLILAVSASAGTVRTIIEQGNTLYADGQYTEAINKYNEALVEQPGAIEPKFNKANSYYRLDDLGEAIDLYREVAAESKDMTLVGKAKYNLGNCFFQRGAKQRDSDLQKALDDMKTSITSWRAVLEIDPQNAKAARNIEVARLTIKDILDQMKQQQEEQKQQNQQDQQDQQQQQGQDQKQDQPQAGKDPKQDPNVPDDAQQSLDKQEPSDPNQADQKDQVDQSPRPSNFEPPDATAREILDKEQRRKEERRNLQRGRTQKVEKDW